MANEVLAKDFEVQEEYELPFTIKLLEPIEWGSETKEVLVISRRLKAKDFKGMRATDMKFDDSLKLISKASGESISFIEEMDAGDFMVAQQVVQSFLPPSLTTGENP